MLTSTYTETGFTATAKTGFYVAGTSNMYVNREPRFYNTITFNGATVPFVAKTGQTHVQFGQQVIQAMAMAVSRNFPEQVTWCVRTPIRRRIYRTIMRMCLVPPCTFVWQSCI